VDNLNVEDHFINGLLERGSPISVFLMSGVCLVGQLVSHDSNCIILKYRGNQQLIYKIAIATISLKNGEN